MFSPAQLQGLIEIVCDAVASHADELTALDQAIGDGDHGFNMARGFAAVRGEAATLAQKPPGEALKAAGMLLVMKVGGASGPLYGTLFMALGRELPPAPSRAGVARAFGLAIDAVKARGKSDTGQKTMLDVLAPVHAALLAGEPLAALADTADTAAQATIPVEATRGRASFLGPRSIGHMDPGSRSCAVIIRAACAALGSAGT